MLKSISRLDIEARIAPGSVNWPSTAVHWEKLKEAVEAVRGLVAAVDANCRGVEQDADLSLEGIARKRAQISRRACTELADCGPVKAAESAVSRALSIFEAGMVDLPKPPASLADIALAQEVRAHVRAQQSPITFVLKNIGDARVVGAVLYAPGFLAGLKDDELNIVREKARSSLHPEQVQLRKAAEDALSELHRGAEAAKRLILRRTDTSLAPDGQVHKLREPQPVTTRRQTA